MFWYILFQSKFSIHDFALFYMVIIMCVCTYVYTHIISYLLIFISGFPYYSETSWLHSNTS